MRAWLALCLCVGSLSSIAVADEPPPAPTPEAAPPPQPPQPIPPPTPPPPLTRARAKPTLGYENALFGRVNPLGAGDDLRLKYRIPLYGSANPVLETNFVGVVGAVFLTPSQISPGIGVELQPLSILHFYVGYEPMIHFGDLGSLHSYPSALSSNYSSGAFDTSPAYTAGETYAAVQHRVILSALFQVAFKWFAFRSVLRATYVNVATQNNDPVFYDPIYDILLPRDGWWIHNESDALYRSKFGLVVGARLTISHAWYPPSAFLPGESTQNINTPIVQLGPLVAYTFFEHKRGRFDAPTIFLSLNWNLLSRYRSDQVVSEGIPTGIIGFFFRGTFLGPANY